MKRRRSNSSRDASEANSIRDPRGNDGNHDNLLNQPPLLYVRHDAISKEHRKELWKVIDKAEAEGKFKDTGMKLKMGVQVTSIQQAGSTRLQRYGAWHSAT